MPAPPKTDTAWATYLDRHIAAVAVMGFASGLPLFLSSSTLAARLADAGVDLTTIGLFAAVGVPYTLKFLWAPIIDGWRLPLLERRLGHRRAWILVAQLGVVASLIALAATDPVRAPWWTALAAFALSACSATQDIAIDAYRVELVEPDRQAAAAAAAVFGYRMAMLASGAGALVLAATFEATLPTPAAWSRTYVAMAALMAALAAWNVGLAPKVVASAQPAHRSVAQVMLTYVVDPFVAFARRRFWATTLVFVVCFKLADALAATLQNPFLLDLGFDKPQIASIAKTYGLVASLAGAFLGGAVVRRIGLGSSLAAASVAMLLSNLVFAWQASVGADPAALAITITVENVTGGFGTAAFVAYMALLCDRRYTATQYALLTSASSLARTVLSTSAGELAATLGWPAFFGFTAAAGLPALALLAVLLRAGAVRELTERRSEA